MLYVIVWLTLHCKVMHSNSFIVVYRDFISFSVIY